MAIKGGRKIVVRDIEFRWKFKGPDCRYGEESPVKGHIVVQGEKGRLFANIESSVHEPEPGGKHADGPRYGQYHKASVTPSDIRKFIEKGLDDGWNPTAKGQTNLQGPLELNEYRVVE